MESNFLLINKPENWTSFDVVAYIRKKIYQERKKIGLPAVACKAKVGHAGTLDPFATGLLIVGVGREATKKLDEFKNLPKTYIATIKLGEISDTFDKTGVIVKYEKNIKKILKKYCNICLIFYKYLFNIFYKELTPQKITKVLKKFTGSQYQLPPMYSAKKVNGKKLYELARQGITIKRKKSKIKIYNIKLLEYDYPILKIEVNCSFGTYIRTLANDIGQKLGTGAYCEELVRTKIGEHTLEQAETIK